MCTCTHVYCICIYNVMSHYGPVFFHSSIIITFFLFSLSPSLLPSLHSLPVSFLPPPPPLLLSLTLRITTHVLYAESKFQLGLPPHEFKLHSFLVCFVTDIHYRYTSVAALATNDVRMRQAISPIDQHVYIYCI